MQARTMTKTLLSSIVSTLALLLLSSSVAQPRLLASSINPAASQHAAVRPRHHALRRPRAAPSNTAGSSSGLLAIVDQKEILLHQRVLADEVLRILPAACRDNI